MNPLNDETQQVSGLQGVQVVRAGQAVTLDGLLEHTSPARFVIRHASGDDHRRRRPSSVGTLERFLRENGELADESLYQRVARADQH
jgi:hypothetical protein